MQGGERLTDPSPGLKPPRHLCDALVSCSDAPQAQVVLHDYGFLITKKKLEEEDNFQDCLADKTEFHTTAIVDKHVSAIAKGSFVQRMRLNKAHAIEQCACLVVHAHRFCVALVFDPAPCRRHHPARTAWLLHLRLQQGRKPDRAHRRAGRQVRCAGGPGRARRQGRGQVTIPSLLVVRMASCCS